MKLADRMVDLQRREEGGWVKDPPEWMGLELKVRGANNKDWQKLETKLLNAIPRQRRINGLESEELLLINGRLILETSLLDWRGIENGNGELEPYSKEAARKYLTDPRHEDFIRICVWAANVVAAQKQDEIEDDAKN
jgi:hypothetical protein